MDLRLAKRTIVLALLATTLAACATGRAYTRGQEAAKVGDWDAAVGFYRQALQDDPDRPDYKIALERAMLAASQMYVSRAREFEAANQPEEALRAYRKALEFEPSNRPIALRASEIERMLRDRLEATAPRPEIEKLREQARRQSAEPILNPASRDPLSIRFTNAGIRDVLNFIGNATGINVTYDRDFQDRSITLNLEGVTLEQALQQIMVANQLFYKVLNERTIIVAADTTQKRTQYRGSGHPDVLPVSRRRDRDLAAAHRDRPGRGRGDPADHRREQDDEHHHRSGDWIGRAGRGADDQQQRQAARRSHRRRADSRGEP